MPVDREAGERLQAFMEPRIGKVQPWAEKHGVGRDTIYALWRGREPRPDTLARIARAMGVDYLELLAIRGGAPQATETPADLVAAITAQTAVMAGCLALLPSSAILIYGNTDLWSAATLALACRFGWPAVALALKPTVFPLALLWARDRRWWLAAAGLGALALPFGALWLDYIAAMRNVDGSFLRSVNALPWLAIPLVAWVARWR